jgi:hypothetical protein
MASNTVPSVPSTDPGQARPTWRKRLISAVDRLIDQHIEAAHRGAAQDHGPRKGQSIRPGLMFLTE